MPGREPRKRPAFGQEASGRDWSRRHLRERLLIYLSSNDSSSRAPLGLLWKPVCVHDCLSTFTQEKERMQKGEALRHAGMHTSRMTQAHGTAKNPGYFLGVWAISIDSACMAAMWGRAMCRGFSLM